MYFQRPHIKFPLHRRKKVVSGYITTHIKFPFHGRSKMSFCATVYITWNCLPMSAMTSLEPLISTVIRKNIHTYSNRAAS